MTLFSTLSCPAALRPMVVSRADAPPAPQLVVPSAVTAQRACASAATNVANSLVPAAEPNRYSVPAAAVVPS
jgi:hypothetical protein